MDTNGSNINTKQYIQKLKNSQKGPKKKKKQKFLATDV